MKKVIIYIMPGLAAACTLFACHKYTSMENGNGLPADMLATINGTFWEAADSTQTAVVSTGGITISGISTDGQEVSITLNDTIVGLYVLNQTSACLAVYANLDSVGSYAYSTNQGSDTAQAGGTVNVTSINTAGRTISGIFSFKVYRNSDGSQKNITGGVFYNIPYADQ
jgi:hypothetical protein